MAFQKRPSEFLHQMMNVFKGLEKKLDKLQGDVDYQGKTLTDLKLMVINMTGLTDIDIQRQSRSPRTVSSVQHEAQTHESRKVKRKSTRQPSPNKLKPKSLPKFGLSATDTKKQLKKTPSSPMKQSLRLSKADVPRKATMMRTQKNKMEKTRKPKKSKF